MVVLELSDQRFKAGFSYRILCDIPLHILPLAVVLHSFSKYASIFSGVEIIPLTLKKFV